MANHYILNTDVIRQNPEFLALSSNYHLVIPQLVIEEIKKIPPRYRRGTLTLLDKAISKGAILANVPLSSQNQKPAGLSITDFSIVNIALNLAADKTNNVNVVTNAKALTNYLETLGICSLTGRDLLNITLSDCTDNEFIASVHQVRVIQSRFALSIFVGWTGAVFGNAGLYYWKEIISITPIWVAVLFLPILGGGLFSFRENYRLFYGMLEFFFGLICASVVFLPSFTYSEAVDVGIRVFGGLYVMVRGLDNISKALEGTELEGKWRRVLMLQEEQ